MLTGDQYRESIRDGRASYIEGERIEDAPTHPLTRTSVDWVAKTYDRYFKPEGHNPLYDAPRSAPELEEQMSMLLSADPTAASTAGCMALRSVSEQLGAEYAARLDAFLDRCRDNDLRVAAAESDASPVRIVSRSGDGIVLRGGKQHVIGGAIAHEILVVPAREMSADEADLAVACALPVNTPGIKLVSTTTAPRSRDTRHFPYSRDHSIPDSLVILEDVFVPNDRVFLDGDVSKSGILGETLGVWERARSTAMQADQAEILLGLARTIAEMNGVEGASHIRDKLAAMAVYARMCRAGWEAALAHARTAPNGMVVPDDSYIYATRAYGVTLYSEMAGWVHDIGGALILTAPTVADYENEATHMYVEKYMSTGARVRGEDRMRIFHLIRDLTADAYAGWSKMSNQMVGGGMFAQRLAALDSYDLREAQHKARQTAHIVDD
jgi:4-hydroxybutyryl-CoA dehydratase/vinylacetyl-CoA-Delta-isomerase